MTDNILPTMQGTKNFFKAIPNWVYGLGTVSTVYGILETMARNKGTNCLDVLFNKLSPIAPDPLTGIGIGIAALSGSAKKPITYALIGAGVSALDNLAKLVTDASYSFNQLGTDIGREGVIMAGAYGLARAAVSLKDKLTA